MLVGFLIWSLVCLLIVGIGISTWRQKEATGFFTGVKAPEVTDVKKYNHSVAILWFVYAALMEICGIPLLFLEQNSMGFIYVILAVIALTIALVIVYHRIETKYRK